MRPISSVGILFLLGGACTAQPRVQPHQPPREASARPTPKASVDHSPSSVPLQALSTAPVQVTTAEAPPDALTTAEAPPDAHTASRTDQAEPEFVDADPTLLARLTIRVPTPGTLADPTFRAARRVFLEVTRGVATHSLTERQDPLCQQALVTDSNGTVRGFTEFKGSEHSYAEIRRFFDDTGSLRLLLFTRNDEQGGSMRDLVAFDSNAVVVGCRHIVIRTGLPAPDLCSDNHPEPNLSPAVKAVLRLKPPHRPRNDHLERLQTIDPEAVFGNCTRYRGSH